MRAWRNWLKSMSYALSGLRFSFISQPNMRFHILASILVAVLTLLLPLSIVQILFIVLAVCFVMICELINTSIEAAIDLTNPGFHPLAKIAKDVAAAAVLVSAFFAVITGGMIYIPIVLTFVREGFQLESSMSVEAAIAATALIVLALQASFGRMRKGYTEYQEELSAVEALAGGIADLPVEERQVLDQAIKAREQAYVPYSKFPVGSAVMSDDGAVYTGCNIENAAYGSTNCAERTALFTAIASGAGPGTFRVLAVVGDTEGPLTPCGACRQVLIELCDPGMPVITANLKGQVARTTVDKLLPGAFSRQVLNREGE